MKLVFLVVLLLLAAGCPPAPRPPAPLPVGYPTCTGADFVVQTDLCADMFTPDWFACATCRPKAGAAPSSASGCVDDESSVYCANANCFEDPLCTFADITGADSSRRPRVKVIRK